MFLAVLHDRAFLRVTGADATRWLNGMVTNSIQSLLPGVGNYNFLLNAQGRIQGDCTIFREQGSEPTFLLETTADQIDTIQALFDKFIIMDDVELARAYEQEESLLLFGEESSALLVHLGLPAIGALQMAEADSAYGAVLMTARFSPGSPSFELRTAPGSVADLVTRAVAFGARMLTAGELETVRILSGEPRYASDIRDRALPQETNQTHALHFAKGCYLGQEIVERIRSRGQVHRVFTALILDGTLPDLPAPLEASGKPAGEITSATQVGDKVFALGYTRREALDAKQILTYPGGTATPRTTATTKSIQQHETSHG